MPSADPNPNPNPIPKPNPNRNLNPSPSPNPNQVAAGALDGGWLLPLLGVPRRAAAGGGESDGPFPPAVELPTGEALRVNADVRVLIEVASLAHAPPHAQP